MEDQTSASMAGTDKIGLDSYAEIQVVEEIFDKDSARKMGIDKVGASQSALLLLQVPAT